MRSARLTRRRSWAAAATAAVIGWVVSVLLGIAGARLWSLLAGVAAAMAFAVLYARGHEIRCSEFLGYTFACIVLGWFLLYLPTLVIWFWVFGAPRE
jgi:hypothetical protein